MTRLYLVPLLLAALSLAACDPCTNYCEEQCLCDGEGEGGEANSSCVDACMETMEVYTEDARRAECTERLEVLQEECR